ncbi:hypothetical protein N7462_000342 [Penicillium macrosclerotiorum]|uniref:uncharacterized protein n=1 Tax=Penicillium macrosclerotiorum TaxID=303699 RepID=UPI002547E7A2|nr:uncharacterized protein N7462_000342 [Penicillium macrosclerotiorum]KAJ5698337.1 hypothetical protein N7462_000342 [Penicillium macrosclerotiorum]
MNKGMDQNVMTQLAITSNKYSLITVCYYGIVLMCNAASKNKGSHYTTRFYWVWYISTLIYLETKRVVLENGD